MPASNNDMPDAPAEDLPGHVADHFTHRAAPWLIRGLDTVSLLIVLVAVFAIGRWSIPLPNGGAITAGVPADIQPREPVSPAHLPPDVQVVGYNAWLPEPSDLVDYLLNAADVLPSALILLFIMRTLRAVVASISHGEAFTEANALRVCLMGAVLLIGTPVDFIFTALAYQWQVVRAGLDDDVVVTLDVLGLVFPILGGLLLLVLGGVLKVGVRMRNDVEGLV